MELYDFGLNKIIINRLSVIRIIYEWNFKTHILYLSLCHNLSSDEHTHKHRHTLKYYCSVNLGYMGVSLCMCVYVCQCMCVCVCGWVYVCLSVSECVFPWYCWKNIYRGRRLVFGWVILYPCRHIILRSPIAQSPGVIQIHQLQLCREVRTPHCVS